MFFWPLFVKPRDITPKTINAAAKIDPLTTGVIVLVRRRTASPMQTLKNTREALLLFMWSLSDLWIEDRYFDPSNFSLPPGF